MHKLNVCKVLHVFLDDQTYKVEIFGEDYMKRFIGARALSRSEDLSRYIL